MPSKFLVAIRQEQCCLAQSYTERVRHNSQGLNLGRTFSYQDADDGADSVNAKHRNQDAKFSHQSASS